MAVEIARSLEEIDNKVKGLNKTLRESSAETKELDKALKLDPKSAETVEKRMKSLQTAVGTAAQKVALLKQKQDEANKAFARGDISAAEYKKIELSVIKAENEVKGLNAEIGKTQKMRVDAVAGSFDKLTAGLGKVQSAAQKVSKVATAILTTLTAAASAELMVALLPVILELVQIAQETVIPILTTIANWFAGMSPEQQKLVFFLLMLLIIMPKVIAIITAIVGVIKAITVASYASAGGLGAVSVAGAPLWAIILAFGGGACADYPIRNFSGEIERRDGRAEQTTKAV
jgi:hypothetical protein